MKGQVYLKEYEVYKAYQEPLRIWLSVPDLVSGPLAIYITSIFAFLEVFGMWGGSKMAYSLASSWIFRLFTPFLFLIHKILLSHLRLDYMDTWLLPVLHSPHSHLWLGQSEPWQRLATPKSHEVTYTVTLVLTQILKKTSGRCLAYAQDFSAIKSRYVWLPLSLK